ncbi:hypothetical protein FE257_002649 [Aspergillus nanangensis]|uniref:Uncharacterized protein n=1 Tax=Aspergillus nanangensis TaxID=2582783 RepID=A0AAD4GQ16_ASPNN|nr:hypothetical protein FE257_002649 [Aspergillus nanangensis]
MLYPAAAVCSYDGGVKASGTLPRVLVGSGAYLQGTLPKDCDQDGQELGGPSGPRGIYMGSISTGDEAALSGGNSAADIIRDISMVPERNYTS